MKVAYHPLVIDFLEQLTFELYEKGYFGFYDSACEYVDKMVDDISGYSGDIGSSSYLGKY